MESSYFKKIIPIVTILIVMFIVTIYKINKNREEKLYNVLYGKIEYVAKDCFLNADCEGIITLQDLYDKDYLETQYDPITKEILDSKKTIEFKDDKIIIDR